MLLCCVYGRDLHYYCTSSRIFCKKDFWNPVVEETLNYQHETGFLHHRFINPGNLGFIYAYMIGLRKYGTIVGHIPCVTSCISKIILRHGGVVEARHDDV